MDVFFDPAVNNVKVGDEFVVNVFVQSTDHEQVFDNVRLLMDYDYSKLEILGTTDPLAIIEYVYTIPMYHWVSPVQVTADQQLPGIRFKALAPVTDMPITLSGPVVDELGNSYEAVKLNCHLDLQGTPLFRGGAGPTFAAITARSYHPGGVNMLLADGSVRFIKDSIAGNVWRGLGSISGGDVISADAY
jgi:prepilin-type processing-associated H-X9-DG protein